MIKQVEFSLASLPRGFHVITREVVSNLPELPKTGILNLFIKHTSAAISLNENYDSDVLLDMEKIFSSIVKENESLYRHNDEGPDDMPAHGKSSIIGVSINIPISDHKLNLGTWQGIYLCEFRNYGGRRNFVATIIGE